LTKPTLGHRSQISRALALAISRRHLWQGCATFGQFGILFSAVYVLFALALSALGASALQWMLWFCVIFPLIYPFTAIAIFDVSRELELTGEAHWGEIMRATMAEKDHHLFSLGSALALLAIVIMSLSYMLLPADVWRGAFGLTTNGLVVGPRLLLGGLAIILGAAMLFAVTVMSIPVILDKELDVITAVIISVDAVWQNRVVFALFAAVSLAVLILASLRCSGT